MNFPLPRILAAAAFGFAGQHDAFSKSYRLTIAAGETDRTAQVVEFALPADAPSPCLLRAADDRAVALQVDPDGRAHFIVARQKADETLAFALVAAPATPPETVATETAGADLVIRDRGQPVLAFRMDKDVLPRAGIDPKLKRAGYLHPVYSPSGRIVTGDYPSNHPHQHGIWSAWTKTQFQGRAPNFWDMAKLTGTVEFAALERKWSGPVDGGFVSRQRFIDLTAPAPIAALNETWVLTAYDMAGALPSMRMFDLVVTQSCATGDPVVLQKYYYGGLGFRGRDEWNGRTNLTLLTSNGETDRNKANATRVRWCYAGGAIDGGAVAGLAIFSDPRDPGAPPPLRVHTHEPYMPYFCFAPTELGALTIAPGKPYVARYRIIVTDGPPDRAYLETCWNAYAAPAAVRIEPL